MNPDRSVPRLLSQRRRRADMAAALRRVHDLLFPARCIGCNVVGAALCPRCAQRVQPVGDRICQRCGHPQSHVCAVCANCADPGSFVLSMARAAALHRSPLREAIHAFKYEDHPELGPLLGRYLVAAYAKPSWRRFPTDPVIVPVPLHPDRLVERGYNQAALLAAALAQGTGLPLAPTHLVRARHTPHQVGLNAVQRHQNVANAFVAAKGVAGQHVLLVDDVCTTGATLNACAAALLAAGAADVCALTLAVPAFHPPAHS